MNDATVVLSTSEMISSLSQRCTIIDRDEECEAEYILDLQKQLTLMSSEEKRESNGTLSSEDSIPSMTTVKNWFVQNLLSCARRHVSLRSQLDDAVASEW